MKLLGTITKRGDSWILQVPGVIVKVAELNGVKLTDKVRLKVRIYKDDKCKDVDVKSQSYYTKGSNLQLILPQGAIQELGLNRGDEIVFEVIE